MLTISIFLKLVIAFVVTLTYPVVSDDVADTFGMDIACNMADDCEITISRGESWYTKTTSQER